MQGKRDLSSRNAVVVAFLNLKLARDFTPGIVLSWRARIMI
jgi:hypothetical protein